MHQPEVSYFSRDEVRAAFQRGSVLLDGAGRNYMVHASRREKAGQAEVHALDTDVIYVLDGSATLVTGGTVVGGKTTEPNEVRGDAIDGGQSRRIGRGDVITVPNGTPHWFQGGAGPAHLLRGQGAVAMRNPILLMAVPAVVPPPPAWAPR
ncbi:MAG: hypothetical protein IPK12_00020 [Gemmatimonadetes bacterium]|nr:hypothetical protein [Gemmatimonadota bacterium]